MAAASDGGEEDIFLEKCLVKLRQASHQGKLLYPHKECEEEVERRIKDGTFATKADFFSRKGLVSHYRHSHRGVGEVRTAKTIQ